MYNSGFIDVKPISVNQCFQGRRFRTKEFKDWQLLVISSLPKDKLLSKQLGMRIRLYFKTPTRMDLDNYVKAIIDCCVKRKIIVDDRYIYRLEVNKIKADVREEGFEVEIFHIGIPETFKK